MSKLEKIKPKNLVVGGILVSIITSILGYSTVVVKVSEDKANFDKEKTSLIQSRDLATQERDDLVEYKIVHPKTLDVSDTVSLSFPTSAEIDDLTRQILESGAAAKLNSTNISNISTTVPVAKTTTSTVTDEDGNETTRTIIEPVARMEISINASGTQEDIVKFVENLGLMDRAVLISGVNYSLGSNDENTASISAISYLYEPLVDPDSTEEDAPIDGVESETETDSLVTGDSYSTE